MVDGIENLIDTNQKLNSKCEKVRSSKIIENWRRAYLHGNDEQARGLLREILHQLEGDDNIQPLLENLAQINMYDEDKNVLQERLAPTRFFSDILVSTRQILGPKNFLVAEVCTYVANNACNKYDSRRVANLHLEELNIRRMYPKRKPIGCLWAFYEVAIGMSCSGQTEKARATLEQGVAFMKKNGLEKSLPGIAITNNLKDAKSGVRTDYPSGKPR
jgi:hypothetical protein